jgi:hypothetical protein
MSKHKHGEVDGSVAAEVAAEAPKTKIGDKVETAVDAKEKTPRVRTPKTAKYRILDGVDVSKFAGQRKQVVIAMQKLDSENPGASYSLDEIVSNVEGLVSKTPVEASVKYHLNGLVNDKQVEATGVEAAPAATVAA